MAGVFGLLKSKLQLNHEIMSNYQQVRYKWANWRMKKDVRKRTNVTLHAKDKLRITAMRRNDILPPELRELATEDLMKLPRDCLGLQIVGRCAITSRPRGNVPRWRVSRIVFRDLADLNKLSGVMRAMW